MHVERVIKKGIKIKKMIEGHYCFYCCPNASFPVLRPAWTPTLLPDNTEANPATSWLLWLDDYGWAITCSASFTFFFFVSKASSCPSVVKDTVAANKKAEKKDRQYFFFLIFRIWSNAHINLLCRGLAFLDLDICYYL